jgi:hypothetical protein
VNGLLSLLLVGLGVAVVARTVEAGIGGGLGLLLGGVLLLLGAARLYLGRR